MANRLTDVISPLLAYGILRLRGHKGYEGWRWLFLLEGLLTLAIGIWSWFTMAPSPTQTKTWWRPKGWFTEREEKILVNRILRDDPSKGGMHNRQAITPKLLWKSIRDFDIWPLYALGLTFGIPAEPPDQYLTLTLRNLGFDTFQSNLLSIPAQVMTTVCVSPPFIFSLNTSMGLFGKSRIQIFTSRTHIHIHIDAHNDIHIRENPPKGCLRIVHPDLVLPLSDRVSNPAREYLEMEHICSTYGVTILSNSYATLELKHYIPGTP